MRSRSLTLLALTGVVGSGSPPFRGDARTERLGAVPVSRCAVRRSAVRDDHGAV
jgi:phosphoenolpyruvate carboxylase